VDEEARERVEASARDLYRTLTRLRNFNIVNYTGTQARAV
jgi:hypothetical protein